MSEKQNPNSKKILFDGSRLSFQGGMIKYGEGKSKSIKEALGKGVGGRKFTSLRSALDQVEKDLKTI